MPQSHSSEDDQAHIEHLLHAFADPRYIRIDGRPLFLVYRTALLPDPVRTAEIWRERARAAGFDDLYLVRVENWTQDVDPKTIGFDAGVEFAPDWRVVGLGRFQRERDDLVAKIQRRLARIGVIPSVYLDHRVYEYEALIGRMLAKPPAAYKRFLCATPGWDNSARRARNAVIFRGSTPRAYERWLRSLVESTVERFEGDEQLVFVNAWNEWAEGNHLEPDQQWGRAYLEATARAVSRP